MKINEIRQKTPIELNKTLKELREKLRDLRFKLTLNKLKNVREIRGMKKDIAKILTILRQKENKA